MRKVLLLLAYGLLYMGVTTYAQTTVSTTYTPNNSSSGVTFNFANNNTFGVLIQEIEGRLSFGSNTTTFELWMNNTPVSGVPGAISTANGWTMVGTSTIAASTTIAPIVTGMNLLIQPNDTVGFYVRAVSGNISYNTISPAVASVFTAGGCDILCGPNMSYGGSITGPTFHPRGLVGGVTFIPAVACGSTVTAGTLDINASGGCAGNPVILGLTGATLGTGLSYQYYESTSATGPWTLINADSTLSSVIDTPTVTTYYYAVLKCDSTGASDTTVVDSMVLPPLFPAGTYTIDQNNPTSATNFASIADAVAAISCGTTGPVIFNVVAGSGPYAEQLILPEVLTNSATSTITFNGNGETLSPAPTSSDRAGVIFDNADYFIVKDFDIAPTGTYQYGVHFVGDADNDTLMDCDITVGMSSSTSNHQGIVFSGAKTSYTSSNMSDNVMIMNNVINGGNYGMRLYANFNAHQSGNQIIGNEFKDFYSYALYASYQDYIIVKDNIISRPNRTAGSFSTNAFYINSCDSAYLDGNHIMDLFPNITSTGSVYMFALYGSGNTLPYIVTNNISDPQSSGGTFYGIRNTADNSMIQHNTLDFSGNSTYTSSNSKYGYYTTSTGATDFSNNIVYMSFPSGSVYGTYASSSSATLGGGNNWFYLDTNNATNYYRGKGVNYNTLADMQAATGEQTGSLELDPMFTNAPMDYTPTNYAFDNYGLPLGVMMDYNDSTRMSPPDVGALEFMAPPCTAPPTAGTATATDTIMCQGFMTGLSLTGNSIGSGQTYTWQWSPTAGGTYTDIDSSVVVPLGTYTIDSTGYYRCMVICGTDTAYSTDVFIQTNPPLPAGTYTIDAGSPASATNFTSFTSAVDALSCGITGPIVMDVVAGSGPYNEQVIIPEIVGASAANTITFNGNGELLHFDTPTTAVRATLILNGADYVTIDDLVIEGISNNGIGVTLTNSADYNTISNCTITVDTTATSSSLVGLAISGSTSSGTTTGNNGNYNTIIGNTIKGGYYGLTVYGVNSTTPVEGNKVIDNTLVDFYFSGIRAYYTSMQEIIGNDISSPSRTNSSFAKYGIYAVYSSDGIKINKNAIHNMWDAYASATGTNYNIYISSSDATTTPNEIFNNEMYYDIHAGTAYGVYDFGSDNTHIYHNTFVFDNPLSSSTVGTARGVYITGLQTGTKVKNNNIVITESGTKDKYGLYYSAIPDESDNNNVYFNTTSTTSYFGYSGGAQSTLFDFQSVTATDSNSLSIDPQFLPLTNDVTPLNTLMDNLGTPVGVSRDFAGNFRSTTTPDIGSREFPVCNLANTAITSSIASNEACAGDTSLMLTAPAGTGMTYQWQLNGADISGETGITFMPTMSGSYSVIIDSSGCIASQDTPTTVTIHALPMVSAGADFAACDMSQVTLNGMGADSYTWDNGVTDGVAFTLNGTTTFVVEGMDSTTGCANVDTVEVMAMPLPTADAGADMSICSGDNVTLTGTTDGNMITWDNGVMDGVPFAPTATTSYVMTATDSVSGCTNMDTVQVTVNSAPTASLITFTPASNAYMTFTFSSNASGATSYMWDFGDGNTDNVASPTHTYTNAGSTPVTLIVTNSCGSDTVQIDVPVSIQDIDAAGISVYPNPVKEEVLTIEMSNGREIEDIRLINALGQEVRISTKALNGTQTKVYTDGISAGVYTLLIETEEATYKHSLQIID